VVKLVALLFGFGKIPSQQSNIMYSNSNNWRENMRTFWLTMTSRAKVVKLLVVAQMLVEAMKKEEVNGILIML
jgi:hypothetical protein